MRAAVVVLSLALAGPARADAYHDLIFLRDGDVVRGRVLSEPPESDAVVAEVVGGAVWRLAPMKVSRIERGASLGVQPSPPPRISLRVPRRTALMIAAIVFGASAGVCFIVGAALLAPLLPPTHPWYPWNQPHPAPSQVQVDVAGALMGVGLAFGVTAAATGASR